MKIQMAILILFIVYIISVFNPYAAVYFFVLRHRTTNIFHNYQKHVMLVFIGKNLLSTNRRIPICQGFSHLFQIILFSPNKPPTRGGGGGALGYLGGRIRSLSKLKNTPKALISGQKSTLILIKTLTFSTK